jgi:hypothetical protein
MLVYSRVPTLCRACPRLPIQARLDTLAQLDRPQRLAAVGRLELQLLRQQAPLAAFGTPTIPEFFSARVGCKTFSPVVFGVEFGALCLHGGG